MKSVSFHVETVTVCKFNVFHHSITICGPFNSSLLVNTQTVFNFISVNELYVNTETVFHFISLSVNELHGNTQTVFHFIT